ncbi:MAG: calcium/sodium antiporter [Geminicoccaceae bacterium]
MDNLPFPPVALWAIVLVVGLAVLVKASDIFTAVAETAGICFGMSPFIVGVTIVAFGTSLPEMVSSVVAVLQGASAIVAGNVVGSNIANLLLILGIAAIIDGHIRIRHEIAKVDLPFLCASSFFLAAVLWNTSVHRGEALMLIVGLGLYLHYALTNRRGFDERNDETTDRSALTKWLIIKGVVSAACIYLGAELTVTSVIELSQIVSIGTEVIAATAVAFGTSLPEVMVTIAAARKGQSEMAVGNVLGSNIFNAFAVVGVAAMIGPLAVPPTILDFALPFMVLVTILGVFMMMEKEITRYEGGLMILFYVYFLAAIVGLV